MKPDHSAQEELKQIAPFLASLPKSHPFTVPENYFDSLEAKLISVTRIEDGIREGGLLGLTEHPFKVPENYFQEFPSALLSRIKNEKKERNEIKTVIPLSKKLYNYKFWLAAASIVVIMAVSISLFTRYQQGQTGPGKNQYGLMVEAIESSDLLYAADLDAGLVVDLFIQDQNQKDQENSSLQPNNESDYLRDAADIDPYLINEMWKVD